MNGLGERTTGGIAADRRRRPRRRRGILAGTIGALSLIAASGAPAVNAAEVTAGSWTFDVDSAPVSQDHYQAAYSAETDSLWVTGTTHQFDLGYPVAAQSRLSEVDPDTLDVTRTVVPRTLDAGAANERPEAAYGLAVDDVHDRVWTTATREGTVVVYDRATGDRVATLAGSGHPRDVAIDPYRGIAYVSDPTNRVIAQYDTETLARGTDIQAWNDPSTFSPMSLDLVADEDSALLYTVGLDDGTLIVTDTIAKTRRVIATGGQRASGVAVDPTRNRAYVASQDSADLRTVDLETGQVIATVDAGAAALNVAVDSERGLVYTAVFGGNSVLVTDADTGQRIGHITVGAAPNDVIVADGSAWAVDRSRPTGDPDGKSNLWRITPTGSDGPGGPGGPEEPQVPTATATVTGTPSLGGTITLTGTGWLAQDGERGSVIAVKLDDGAITTPSGEDVWQVIQAGADGSFSAQIRLPDGTADPQTGSSPAYSTGAHSLRLLTGSLLSGDRPRSQRIDIQVAAAQGTDPSPGDGGGSGGTPPGDTGGGTPPVGIDGPSGPPAPSNTTRPQVRGNAIFGARLAAGPGTWQNADGATFAYRWFRGGVAIPKATGKTYRVGAKDVGTRLSVRVTRTTASGSTGVASRAVVARRATPVVRVALRHTSKRARRDRTGDRPDRRPRPVAHRRIGADRGQRQAGGHDEAHRRQARHAPGQAHRRRHPAFGRQGGLPGLLHVDPRRSRRDPRPAGRPRVDGALMQHPDRTCSGRRHPVVVSHAPRA